MNWKIIDRLFLAWALILASILVFRYVSKPKFKGDTVQQISQIYDWCQSSLAPAQEEKP
jgi:hypothetical protein